MTKQTQKSSNHYLKYSGMVFQLFVLLLLGAKGGAWIDAKMGNEKPFMTALLLLVFVIAYLYKIYLDLAKDK